MTAIDPRLASALEEQLAEWRTTLRTGAKRVGWKLGVGDRERIEGEIAVGHLTSATVVSPGSTYVLSPHDADLRADVELTVEIGRDLDPSADADAVLDAITGYGVALEIVDLTRFPNERPQSVVATNIFHRGVAFGPTTALLPREDIVGKLVVRGETRAAGPVADDFAGNIATAARLLAAVGERVHIGDLIITGSIAQVPVSAGDDVSAEIEKLGEVRLSLAQ